MYFALWLIRRCRLPATPAFSLPDAVILKRFLTPDFVFSFGISRRSAKPRPSGRVDEPPWHAFWPGGSEGRGRYAKEACNARRRADEGEPPYIMASAGSATVLGSVSQRPRP